MSSSLDWQKRGTRPRSVFFSHIPWLDTSPRKKGDRRENQNRPLDIVEEFDVFVKTPGEMEGALSAIHRVAWRIGPIATKEQRVDLSPVHVPAVRLLVGDSLYLEIAQLVLRS